MPISRLLSVSLLIAMCAAQVTAQSSTEKISATIQPAGSVQQSSSSSPDLLLLFPNLQTEPGTAETQDRIQVGEYDPQLSQFSVPRFLRKNSDQQSTADDSSCFTMRSYKVARDNPQSDSTHFVGSSTCQPSARFQLHTTEERVLVVKPDGQTK
jgi:hypothetical protein